MNRVLDWVRALAGGRRRVAGRPPGSDMVVLLRPAAVPRLAGAAARGALPRGDVVVQRHAGEHHHHHVARWRRVTEAAPRVLTGTTGAPGATGPAGAAGASGAVLAFTRTPVATRAGQAVAARVVTTHRRVEGAGAPARAVPVAAVVAEAPRSAAPAPAAPPPPVPPAPRAAPMVLRTPAPAARAADPGAPTTEPPPGAPRGRVRDLHAPPADAAPTSLLDDPARLAALTDRIVAQIDRRMTAHRERLGQL